MIRFRKLAGFMLILILLLVFSVSVFAEINPSQAFDAEISSKYVRSGELFVSRDIVDNLSNNNVDPKKVDVAKKVVSSKKRWSRELHRRGSDGRFVSKPPVANASATASTVASTAVVTKKVPNIVRALPGKGGGSVGAASVVIGIYGGWEFSEYLSFSTECDNPIVINRDDFAYHDCREGICYFDITRFDNKFFDSFSDDKCVIGKNETIQFVYQIDGKLVSLFGVSYLGRHIREESFWDFIRLGQYKQVRFRIDNFLNGKRWEYTIREFHNLKKFDLGKDVNKFLEINDLSFDISDSHLSGGEDPMRFLSLKVKYNKVELEKFIRDKILSERSSNISNKSDDKLVEASVDPLPDGLSIVDYLEFINANLILRRQVKNN
jgi:hypothetical protein